MRCSLPPHAEVLVFKSYDEFETHYSKFHTNRCLECRKSFPSQHLLDLHLEECHDAFTAVRREKGEHTFSCFVEGCERKCRTPQKRRLHLIDKHMYPKNYFFSVTRDGVAGRRSMLLEGGHRRRRSSIATKETRRASLLSTRTTESTSTEGEASTGPNEAQNGQAPSRDVEMDELSGAMSSLQFIPPSVRFGRGGRSGFQKR